MLQINNPFADRLLKRRHTGQKQLTSQTVCFLKQCYGMSAKSQYPSGSHTRNTTPGHSDMLLLLSRKQSHFQLFSTGRIDNTARRVTLRLFSHTTDHTAGAWCDFLQLIFGSLIDQIRISQQGPTEHDTIHQCFIYQIHSHGRIQHLANNDDRHTADLADSRCLRNIDTLMLAVTWNDFIRTLILCTTTDFKGIDTMCNQLRHQITHILHRISLCILFISAHTQNDRKVPAAGCLDRIDHLKQKTCSMIQTSSIRITALIAQR